MNTKQNRNQTAYITGWLRHIRNGSAVDVIRATGDVETNQILGLEELMRKLRGGSTSPTKKLHNRRLHRF